MGFALAKASEQFRQSDVTIWGIVALVMAGIAVMGANVSALMPQSMLSGLHKTRIDGASIEQLRDQVAQLREETLKLRRENGVLTARFNLGEQQSSEVIRRVGALEVSLPGMIETASAQVSVDSSSITSAISGDPALVYEADGGSVLVRQQPMPGVQSAPPNQPLPEAIDQLATAAASGTGSYGVALGPAIAADEALAAWRDLDMKLGPLLFGMAPMLADESNGNGKRIVVGPISQLAEATTLCGRLERISVACLPVPFTGTPLDY